MQHALATRRYCGVTDSSNHNAKKLVRYINSIHFHTERVSAKASVKAVTKIGVFDCKIGHLDDLEDFLLKKTIF